MMRIARALWALLAATLASCRQNKVLRLAAALSYYAMFSLAPLLVLVILGAGLTYGERVAEREVMAQIETVIGARSAQALGSLLASVETWRSDPITTAIGIVGLLVAASVLFHHLRDALNTIWNVAPLPGRGVRGFLRDRCLAVLMVAILGLLALLGLLISIGFGWSSTLLSSALPFDISITLIRAAQMVLGVVVVTLLVALTYKLLPNTTISWRDCFVGALTTALLLVGSQALVGLYLRSSFVGSAYSAIGAIVLILVWVYCAALVFFFGAELTWVYASRYGSRIVPEEDAIVLSPDAQVAQGMEPTSAPLH